ncbi:small nuclear ribonucleoprotein (snRNP)-like protein [Peribacillus sp. B2I2]|uniref:hypothetical protein n=1 Tax=Peribacillus sp. B2I2 TaxID=3156468 RepID=UPI003517A977
MFFSKKDCLCELMEKYVGQNVTIRTKSGDIIEGELKKVNDCVVQILEQEQISPFLETQLTAVRCEDIESFSVTLPG